MIELPEAILLARQMTEELCGKQMTACVRGNSPHKFAFYNHSPEEYAQLLPGKTLGTAVEHGNHILLQAEPGYVLVLGGGGERILLHRCAETIPARHQFLLEFSDGMALSVTIQMWGSLQLLHADEAPTDSHVGPQRISPLGADFSMDYFDGLFGGLTKDDARSIKYFLISQPGVWGLGNGYLQDILFRARIHPRHRAMALGSRERRVLYKALRETLQQAVEQGGRDTEYDLHNLPGGYHRILDAGAVGQPCRRCNTPIQKASFLGGMIYFCPQCQM
jgi:formamidopyrimidine-DNA glycosylase